MKKVLIYLLIAMLFSSAAAFADILIISNKDVPDTALSQKNVQEIFLGKRVQWSDNSKIHFVTIKNPDIHEAFLKQYLKKSDAKWKAYWKRMVFTGRGTPPQQFGTTQELLEYVSKTDGAVGYIDSETTAVNVKVVNVK
ncbi:Phosphate-binding protein domain-containing protein [Desulfonema limicola]|uniref:Phosphate-binding protein domain-containing protein n=1 Tax=Desulfonema limicola TaxID=45656 RepID=A0A975BDW6_9BACT|nr:substrate-binding domain-containing protein [Desulfonema limicola]QTA83543.1 Phosphate-binding protein domain-containing protein [Desulfonema limicola]